MCVVTSAEGNDDEYPMVCQDSVNDFRALCWALYARYRNPERSFYAVTELAIDQKKS